MTEIEIRARLGSEVWNHFFRRFGTLFPIQKKVIPRVLNREDLLVVSPAATGKTEAVLVPLLKRSLDEAWKGLSILYVVPTRALVNDIYDRVHPGFELFGFNVRKRTGEYRISRIPEDEPTLVITTPESFDSLICRAPALLLDVKTLILDEIHLIHGGPRGMQVRILMERLSRLVKVKDYSLYLMSATPGDVDEIVQFYRPGLNVVAVGTKRRIEMRILKDKGDETARELLDQFRKSGIEKVLIFCLSRKECEDTAHRFDRPPFKGRVFVHHGSLSKEEREKTETEFFRMKRAILIATNTLEIGIDIGDIDAVVLYSPPRDPFSFLQEVGRGCRRQNLLLVFGIYRDKLESMLFEEFLNIVQKGSIPPRSRRVPYEALVQQILSYIFQKRRPGTTLEAINRILDPVLTGILHAMVEDIDRKIIDGILMELDLYRGKRQERFNSSSTDKGVRGVEFGGLLERNGPSLITGKENKDKINFWQELNKSMISSIITQLEEDGYIRMRSEGIYELAPKGEKLADKGLIHSNIQESDETRVFDTEGREIGSIRWEKQNILSLGGKKWVFVSMTPQGIIVRELRHSDIELYPYTLSNLFNTKGCISRNFWIGLLVKKRLFPELDDHQFPIVKTVSEDIYRVLKARVEEKVVTLPHIDMIQYEPKPVKVILHFLGEPWSLFGGSLFSSKMYSVDGNFWVTEASEIDPPYNLELRKILKCIKKKLFRLKDYIETGPFFGLLSENLQVMTFYFFLRDFIEFFNLIELKEIPFERIVPLIMNETVPLNIFIDSYQENPNKIEGADAEG